MNGLLGMYGAAVVRLAKSAMDAAARLREMKREAGDAEKEMSRFTKAQEDAFAKLNKRTFVWGGAAVSGEELAKKLRALLELQDSLSRDLTFGDNTRAFQEVAKQIDDLLDFINRWVITEGFMLPGAHSRLAPSAAPRRGSSSPASRSTSKGVGIGLPGRGGVQNTASQGGISSGRSTGQLP